MTQPPADRTATFDVPGGHAAGLDADVLAKLSHEMRQPLHAMGLFIDNLRDSGLTPAQSELLGYMDEALDRSCRLVDKMKPAQASMPFRGLKVILIDDDELLLESLAVTMRRWGCEVLKAASGAQAHDRLEAAGGHTDLIVSDLRLADGESGALLVGALREKFGPRTPALILTGERSMQAMSEVQACGLTPLHKPVPAESLRLTIESLLRTAPQAHAG